MNHIFMQVLCFVSRLCNGSGCERPIVFDFRGKKESNQKFMTGLYDRFEWRLNPKAKGGLCNFFMTLFIGGFFGGVKRTEGGLGRAEPAAVGSESKRRGGVAEDVRRGMWRLDRMEVLIFASSLLGPTVGYAFREAARVNALHHVVPAVLFGVFGFVLTVNAIPRMSPLFIKANIFGFDINKRGTPNGEIKM